MDDEHQARKGDQEAFPKVENYSNDFCIYKFIAHEGYLNALKSEINMGLNVSSN